MPYLIRRLDAFLSDLKTGRAQLAPEVTAQLSPHLDQVRYQPDGRIDLSSCSPELRGTARAYFNARSQMDAPSSGAPQAPDTPDAQETAALNRELFDHLERMFEAATGHSTDTFVRRGESFGDAARRLGSDLSSSSRLAKRVERAAPEAMARLVSHYQQTNVRRFAGAKALPGSKLVLGGMQSFTDASFAAVRSMALYCDTVLIPDPVFPFLEVDRSEERFAQTRLIEQIFYLCKLKPLADATLPYPAIAVFPSWEKILEANDPITQDGQEAQALRLLSHYCDATFEDIVEVIAFARQRPDLLTRAFSENNLLVAPGGAIGEPFTAAVARQRAHHREWRSPDYLAMLDRMTDIDVAVSALLDRLAPQFHLEENAETLAASPLVALPQQWHYYRLLRRVETETLAEQGVLQPETTKLIEALTQPQVQWLGNVPLRDLIVLRSNLENERFRRDLGTRLKELGDANEQSIDAVTARVSRALSTMVAEHEKEVRRIADDYKHKHLETAVGAWFTMGAAFSPLFPLAAPVIVGSGIAVAAKYAAQKASERLKYNQSRRTLMGMLASAADNADAD